MDRKIKTRQVHKDIKVLDKTVTVTDHVKHSYVRTKETVMQSTEKSSDRENNPVGYAEDAASEYADRIFHETGHQVRRQAGKIIERKTEKASVSLAGEETVYQPKEQIFCLLVNIRKITVQLATCEQVGIKHFAVLFEIAQVPLSPYSNRLIFFFGG